MSALAILVGFLGPFGTYTGASFVQRVQEWAALLAGAYILVRPCIWGMRYIAVRTSLPVASLTLWGTVAASLPLAMIWRAVGQDAYRELDGYTELVPFALLCALAVLAVSMWAEKLSQRLSERLDATATFAPARSDPIVERDEIGRGVETKASIPSHPRLLERLAADFRGPVIALQSEDHYVRVHGAAGSELLLMRLRDAIAELDGLSGEQVHRSWWVARASVLGLERVGRSWSIRLANGEVAPIARESIHRLRQSGFLPMVEKTDA